MLRAHIQKKVVANRTYTVRADLHVSESADSVLEVDYAAGVAAHAALSKPVQLQKLQFKSEIRPVAGWYSFCLFLVQELGGPQVRSAMLSSWRLTTDRKGLH